MTSSASDSLPAAQGIRNTWMLLLAQAMSGTGPLVAVALGGLAGSHLLGDDKSLATLPVSSMGVGLAVAAIPAAIFTQRVGRRRGLMSGTGFAISGGLIAAGALAMGSFWFFTLALFFVGLSNAFIQQYRFAAAESVPVTLRSQAISRVMIGGVITAIVAPQILLATQDLFDPIPFAGGFVALSVVALAAFFVLRQLRFPSSQTHVGDSVPTLEPARPFSVIARQPRFIVALLCAASSYALMSFVMTAAPLAMVDHHHTQAEAVLGIQWHVIAMFAPSLVTGRLIEIFGKTSIVATGLALLIVSAIVGMAGIELFHFWGMLMLLGVGWNFSFVGATAMLTDTYRPAERGRIEGINDLVVFGGVALASFLSGQTLSTSGWETINLIVLPVAAIVLTAVLVLALQERWKLT